MGRVGICPVEWDGWAATEDIIRVVPNDKRYPAGYLCSFLSSPLGQVQLTSQMHGAVIDHLTEDHVGNVLVPLLDPKATKMIDSTMKKGVKTKSQAVALMESAVNELTDRFGGGTLKNQPRKPTLQVPDPSYQPSRAELREDLRLKGTFEEAVKALVKPVKINKVVPKKGSK